MPKDFSNTQLILPSFTFLSFLIKSKQFSQLMSLKSVGKLNLFNICITSSNYAKIEKAIKEFI